MQRPGLRWPERQLVIVSASLAFGLAGCIAILYGLAVWLQLRETWLPVFLAAVPTVIFLVRSLTVGWFWRRSWDHAWLPFLAVTLVASSFFGAVAWRDAGWVEYRAPASEAAAGSGGSEEVWWVNRHTGEIRYASGNAHSSGEPFAEYDARNRKYRVTKERSGKDR